jgi:rsbT co-antagonist protein RsbR
MAEQGVSSLPKIIADNENEILAEWLQYLSGVIPTGPGRIGESELKQQCKSFLAVFKEAIAGGKLEDIRGADFQRVRDMLAEISRARAIQGFSPSETATFIFSLKQPVGKRLREAQQLAENSRFDLLMDQLGLYSVEVFQKSREEVILRQQQEIAELSTPVVKLWDGILALPLIGTLDSNRTQVVMENLLQSIVQEGAEIAIIDITGVPTVDTLVAQHLLKTVAATRLMGADCIISGIRPQIAQTMVHLGVELNVVSKASLADALGLALHRVGKQVVRVKNNAGPSGPGHATEQATRA